MLLKAITNYILNLATFMPLDKSILSSDLRLAVTKISAIYNFYYKRLHKLWTIMVNIICHYDPNYGTITINYG